MISNRVINPINWIFFWKFYKKFNGNFQFKFACTLLQTSINHHNKTITKKTAKNSQNLIKTALKHGKVLRKWISLCWYQVLSGKRSKACGLTTKIHQKHDFKFNFIIFRSATTCCIQKKTRITKSFCMPAEIVTSRPKLTHIAFTSTKLCTKLSKSSKSIQVKFLPFNTFRF